MIVSKNLNDAKKTPNYKRKCGQIIDAILESIEKYDEAFLGLPNSGNGYKIDDCIRKFLPELLNTHVIPFAINNEGCPLKINQLEKWGRDEIIVYYRVFTITKPKKVFTKKTLKS